MELTFKFNLQMFAEGAEGAGEDTPPDTPPAEEKKYTDKQMTDIVAKKEQKLNNKIAKLQKELEAAQAATTPPEAGNTPPATLSVDDTALKEAQAKALVVQEMYAKAEIKAAMAQAGVSVEKLERAVKLVDPNEVLDDGEVDAEQLSAVIAEVIKDWPDLAAEKQEDKAGFKFGADGNSKGGSDGEIDDETMRKLWGVKPKN